MGAASIYQLHVQLVGIEPSVWRRLLVPSDISLDQLHQVLQLSFGWTDSHLHEFDDSGRIMGEPDPDDDDPPEDEAGITLKEILSRVGNAFIYLYDYGDGWEHSIVLEKKKKNDPEATYPSCLAGERSGPPEDCGGVDGYKAFLEAIADPEHEEHEAMLEWIGGKFDAEKIDIDWINELLEAIGRTEWIGAMFPLPEGLLDNAPDDPWVVAWLDASEAVLIEHMVVAGESRSEAAVSLLEQALDEASSGDTKEPDRVRVEDPELAAAVAGKLGDRFEVLQDVTPEVEDIREELIEHIAESWKIVQAMSSYLSGEVAPAGIAKLFEAAALLYRANPWEKIKGRIAIEVQSKKLGLEGGLMSLGGETGDNPGMYIVESPADQSFLLEPISTDLKDEEDGPEGPLRVMFFERGADVPQKMRREISEHSWEVVDAHAYPKILLIGSNGAPHAPTRHDVSIMIVCARALVELTRKHGRDIDAHKPATLTTRVEGLSGPISIRLSSPHPALEPEHGTPRSSYDAMRPPNRRKWLRMSEGDRMDQVEMFHEESKPHPVAPNPTLHAITHVVVETQLALNDPPVVRDALARMLAGGVRDALARMLAGGLDRHEAVHAIGALVSEHILESMQDSGTPDSGSYIEALTALTVATRRSK
ncbi:MAG: DUF1841 family protein [Deltaproteobacteria bacterium]|nr:DUF1841 family protein [Deltaproteobacteria bacterium]